MSCAMCWTARGWSCADGDVALIRTGYLSGWPDADFIAAHQQAGIDRDAALWLARSAWSRGR